MCIPQAAVVQLEWLARLQRWPAEGTPYTTLDAIVKNWPAGSSGRANPFSDDARHLRPALAALVDVVAVGRWRNLTRVEVVASLEAALPDVLLGGLIEWLDHPAVQLEGKAAALATDNPRAVVDTRVLQDIRPVFGDEEPLEIRGALVCHTLRITYVEDGAMRSAEYALGVADVAKLGIQCERAQRQDAELQRMSEKAGVPPLPAWYPKETQP